MPDEEFRPGPVRTVGELMQRLAALPPDLPLLVDGYESGFTDATVDLVEVQELAGLSWFYGRFMPPAEAARRAGPSGEWHLMRGGTPPDRVDEPFTAAVLRRIEYSDED